MCTTQELHAIVKSIVSSITDLVPSKVYKIILYGSYARGDFTEESDIDIMVILDCTKEETLSYPKAIIRLADDIGLEYDIMLSVMLRDKEYFYENQAILPFYQNIMKEGIELYG